MRFPTILSGSKLPNWNLRIKESSINGQWQEVLSHYHEMSKAGSRLEDPSLFPLLLKACANLQAFNQGTSVHGCLIKQGFESFTSIGNSTMNFYMKCRAMDSALGVFYSMENRDSVSWNVVIHGYLDQGACKEGLSVFVQGRFFAGFEPNISTLVLILKACRGQRATHDGLKIHGFIIRSGFSSFVSVQNSVLSMYVDCFNMESARILFDEMHDRDVISWSLIIGGFVRSGEPHIALWFFREMFFDVKVEPDGLTVVTILNASTSVGDFDIGRVVHGYIIHGGFNSDLFVGNSLVDMYGKFNDVDSAFKVFSEMSQRNAVSWNSILSGFVRNQQYSKALALYDSMGKAGIEADEVTLVSLLQLCKNLVAPIECKSIHSTVIRRGYESNELVLNSLVDAYANCNLIELAWEVFKRMKRRDVISWSTMIAGLTHCGKPNVAITIIQEMNQVQEEPNAVTMLGLLEACSVLAEIRKSKWAHGFVIRRGWATNVTVGTAILDMYSKCGAIDASKRVFDQMSERNIVSWSAMIAAYGMNGRAHDALSLIAQMELHSLKPNSITILSVLSACSHGGLVEEGLSFFKGMVQDYGFEPGLEHYSCMVDMLGRAGKLESAMDMIKKMPERLKAGAHAWGALLSACRNYGNLVLGEGAASHVIELEPSSSAGYLLASSMYAAGELWGETARMRFLVKERGVRMVAGYSLVHVDNKAYRFVAGDGSHRHSSEVHAVVEQLHGCMKMDGIDEESLL